MKFPTFLLVLISAVLISGCKKKPEYLTNDPFFMKAKKEYNHGKIDAAIQSYEKSLKLGKSYAAHLELASIYEDEKNYTAAIYHCQKFLEFSPADSTRTALAQDIKTKSEDMQFMILNKTRFKLQPKEEKKKPEKLGEMTKRERVFKEKYAKALKQREATKRELAKVKKELEEAKSTNSKATATRWTNKTITESKTPQIKETSFPKVVEQKVERKESVPQPKVVQGTTKKPVAPATVKIKTTYVVKKGDNLSAISQKFYGTSRNWKKILEANKPELSDPSKLKIGQTIKIPEIKK